MQTINVQTIDMQKKKNGLGIDRVLDIIVFKPVSLLCLTVLAVLAVLVFIQILISFFFFLLFFFFFLLFFSRHLFSPFFSFFFLYIRKESNCKLLIKTMIVMM